MQPEYKKSRVCENIKIVGDVYMLSVEGEFKANPGQFYMLRSWSIEPLLSRPISIHDVDEEKISFLYEVKGEGTRLLSRLKIGDEIELLGPLGNGFDTEKIKGKIAVITGGIGIAPMFYTAKSLKGMDIDLYAGFREDVYTVDKFKPYTGKIHISTDSGKEGHKGFITEIFSPEKYDIVLCCGPEVMMKKVLIMCKKSNVPVLVSMESRMACGIGACLVCTCRTSSGNKRTCKDGPVFWGEDVIIDA